MATGLDLTNTAAAVFSATSPPRHTKSRPSSTRQTSSNQGALHPQTPSLQARWPRPRPRRKVNLLVKCDDLETRLQSGG